MANNETALNAISQSSDDNLIKLCASFVKAAGNGITVLDSDGKTVYSENSCGFNCLVNKNSNVLGNGECPEYENPCAKQHLFSSEQSGRFGGKYIYLCPSNLIFVTVPVRRTNEIKYIICGPLMPMELKDFDIDDLIERLEITVSAEEITAFLNSVPFCLSDKIHGISNLLHILAKHISDETGNASDDKNYEIYKQQQEIGEYIQNLKAELIKDCQTYISYPFDKEKQLFYAITSNDLTNSRKYLNEILGHIFFSSANDLNIIKIRAMELSVMISRAAIEAGADINKIHKINIDFLSGFFNCATIEDVCWSLTEILKKFTRETFEFSNVKHVDLISKAVSYIKTNYMNKISLNDVAEYVYLSPSYFSKIFKEEMNCYFNDYLNNVRIAKCKIMLVTEKYSLVEIAEHVGFYDQSYFNKVFKKFTGVTPKKFREQNGKN